MGITGVSHAEDDGAADEDDATPEEDAPADEETMPDELGSASRDEGGALEEPIIDVAVEEGRVALEEGGSIDVDEDEGGAEEDALTTMPASAVTRPVQ